MKINVVGGGPAGLYFAILMKKADPSREIVVFERNSPDATFGWGVVFSGKTLSHLRAADEASHAAIAQRFEVWDNVDVLYRDAKITVRGNSFSGIARIALLNILQARAEELGVDVRYGVEINEPGFFDDCDLLVGADGVNSVVRASRESAFRPSLDARANKYIWYGTRQLFHGLTLTFRESADGLFAAHSYKFSKSLSTFIVECDPDSWAHAGFDEMDDASTRAYLEHVFARDLGGHELLSNNSKWINFVLVANERWQDGNVVLLGDALHTAHFSIGSGTKLALEDSIALARSFEETEGVEAALDRFETTRRPVIEEYQAAALESMEWFEQAKSYVHLEPMEFAYSLMTRSKKIDYENLKRRDPAFIAAYDAFRNSRG
jgi:anthraniloyl-CoA monooxygenase